MKINKIAIAVLICITFIFSVYIINLKEELTITQNELCESKEAIEQIVDELDITKEDLNSTKNKLLAETNRANELNKSLSDASTMLEEANVTISELKSNEYKLVYMGDFKITYYCDERYSHICGGNGVTASGKKTNVGVTAAADWSVLPKGSKVYIEGIGWREIQDVGGGVDGKHIDVLVKTHKEALNLGTDHEGVWLLIKK